ncbi:MAG: hypothetical protein HY975_02450 [Candidatus Kerfeldbacteria bacterium]|nr:hypothetical protein [Candidatus Kerfeldbacteria bacterium]
MENLNFLAPLLMIAGVAVIILAIIAVVQDMKQERKYGYRQAFFTIVALVMLVMAVGSGVSLLVLGLKQGVFTNAKTYNSRMNTPPTPFLTGDMEKSVVLVAPYTCESNCQFTTADKQNFTSWKTEYQYWKDSANTTQQFRRDLAGALALFLVSLPLYLLFTRWMNRGAKEETQQHLRPSPLRSVYYYGVAFGGLVMAVVGGAMLLNTVLKVALKTTPSNSISSPQMATASTLAADSVIACADKCGFTADDVALVNEWKTQYATSIAAQKSTSGSTANDLANTIPYVIIGFPLFWYHFSRIRKETVTPTPAPIA